MKKSVGKKILKKLLSVAIIVIFCIIAVGSVGSGTFTECYICGDYGADNEVEAYDTYYLCDDCYDDFLEIRYSEQCYICGDFGADNSVGSYDLCDSCYLDFLESY